MMQHILERWRNAPQNRIFISYRREDSAANAGRLHDRLTSRFGDDRVFMDIDDIAPGDDFTKVLYRTLNVCNTVIVVIGRQWADVVDESGCRRLDDPQDFVRMEIETALRRGIRVVPVLVDDATMPDGSELPVTLAALPLRQAVEVRDRYFHDDADRLIASLEVRRNRGRTWWSLRLWGGGLALALIIAYGLFQMWGSQPNGTVRLRSGRDTISIDQFKALLVRHGFYDSRWNRAGGGVSNKFEPRIADTDIVVIDHATRLMWQKSGSQRQMLSERATSYIETMNSGRFGGFADWRLPTLEEALSLVEPIAPSGLHIDDTFERLAAPQMWTSDRGAGGERWVVFLADGNAEPAPPNYNAWIRAVRTLP